MKKLLLLLLLLANFSVKAQTWQLCNNGSCNYITNSFIESTGILLASGGCLSIDSGYTWSLPNGGIGAISLEKNSAGIYAGSDTAIYFSNNNGTTWTNQYVTGSGNSVFGMAVLNDTVFAATLTSGILMSPDNGNTWTQINSGLPNDSAYSILVKGNLLFVGMYAKGIFMSTNSGSNWSAVNSGLPSNAFVRSIATDGINLFAATNGNIYISSNNGTSWTQATIATTSISKIISVGNVLLAGGFTMTGAEGIYRSLDNGTTWSLYNTGLPVNCSYGVGGLYATSSYVYCGIESLCGSIYRINRNDVMTSIVDNNTVDENTFDVFPNPFSHEINFKINSSSISEITLYDNASRKVLQQKFINTVSLITEQLAKGIYMFELRNNDEVIKKGKVVKQ